MADIPGHDQVTPVRDGLVYGDDPSVPYEAENEQRPSTVEPPAQGDTIQAEATAGDDGILERPNGSAGRHGSSDRATPELAIPPMPSVASQPAHTAGEPNIHIGAAPPPVPRRTDDIYEWEILIDAPFAFDFFKLVRSLFRLPARPLGFEGAAPSRKRYYLRVALYNLGRLALILGMIPFAMLAFSYVATLPFLAFSGLSAGIGVKATTALAAVGLVACLCVPILIVLSWFRPTAYRDSYKRSKVELINILWASSLFLASGMLETLIASPVLPLRKDYSGPLESTPQWTLFFADLSMNILFANLPQKFFKKISDIGLREGGSQVSLGLLRLLLIFGFVSLVRLVAMKLCVSKKELFYGTPAELRSYLDYCGKAQARNIRKVVPINDDEIIEVRTRASMAAEDPA